jgi:hypothetical protein
MITLLIKARRYLSVVAASMVLASALLVARPSTALAARCHRSCGSCNNCDPYLYLIRCCDFCIGQEPNCGCTWFPMGC